MNLFSFPRGKALGTQLNKTTSSGHVQEFKEPIMASLRAHLDAQPCFGRSSNFCVFNTFPEYCIQDCAV